jgi:HTH-type transcriptional regulator/antitoxin HipB
VSECHLRKAEPPSILRRAFRKEAGLTRSDVALRLGVTQQPCSTQERIAESVGVARLLKLLGILGIELVLTKTTSSAGKQGVSDDLIVRTPDVLARVPADFPASLLTRWETASWRTFKARSRDWLRLGVFA